MSIRITVPVGGEKELAAALKEVYELQNPGWFKNVAWLDRLVNLIEEMEQPPAQPCSAACAQGDGHVCKSPAY